MNDYKRTELQRSARVVAGLLSLLGCASEDGDNPRVDDPMAQSIIGGHTAIEGSHPWLVSFRADGQSQCAGTLLSARWVLTAAHCFKGVDQLYAEDVTVVLGEHDVRRLTEAEQRRRVRQVVLHPEFLPVWDPNDLPLGNDVALVELRSPVELTDSVQPLPLPSPFDDALNGTVDVAGWGLVERTETTAVRAEVLQEITLAVLPQSACAEDNIQWDEFCAGSQLSFGEVQDTCNGDSGGSVTQRDGSGRVQLVGLVSRGHKRCAGRGTYTRVAVHTPWIESVTGL